MELVCPAGNLPSLKAAVDNGADAVYIGFRDSTNARHFAGLNFTDAQIEKGLRYAQDRGTKVFVAINTYPYPSGFTHWQRAVDRAADLGVDALILADIGVMDYARERWPDLNLHPRVLSLKQVATLIEHSPVPIEVFGFGSLCVMVEGRCYLSSYVTGQGLLSGHFCTLAGDK
jgi:putative protease